MDDIVSNLVTGFATKCFKRRFSGVRKCLENKQPRFPRVDDFEDARFPEFNEAQQRSISGAYLIEPQRTENKAVIRLGRKGAAAQIAPPRPIRPCRLFSWSRMRHFFRFENLQRYLVKRMVCNEHLQVPHIPRCDDTEEGLIIISYDGGFPR
jgi:hypothetical protein